MTTTTKTLFKTLNKHNPFAFTDVRMMDENVLKCSKCCLQYIKKKKKTQLHEASSPEFSYSCIRSNLMPPRDLPPQKSMNIWSMASSKWQGKCKVPKSILRLCVCLQPHHQRDISEWFSLQAVSPAYLPAPTSAPSHISRAAIRKIWQQAKHRIEWINNAVGFGS